MRKLILFALLATAWCTASATRHLTVAQLEKTLTSSADRHHADADMVRMFGDFDLTERLTDETRVRICDSLHLGPKTTLALQLLADESALLDPPHAELPSDPAPDAAAQKRILDAAMNYVTRTLPRLPDLLATRTTYTFNDTPQIFKVNEWPVRAGLHLVGRSSREINFRDDSAAAAAPQTGNAAAAHPAEHGLQSYGDFGRLLGVILVDTHASPAAFHHWERSSSGLVAVYRYSVPRPDSHYAVDYCCLFDRLRTSTRGGGRRGGAVSGSMPTSAATLFHKVPAYHGSLFIDPASGVIRRVTLEAEMGDSPISRAATVIDYGPVVIGERPFVCPLRSMNVYEGPAEAGPPASELPVTMPRSLEATGTLYINETSYANYHRLGSTVRVLSDGAAPSAIHP